MVNSTHRCEVFPVILTGHPNADKLSIVKIDDYQVIVRTDDWQEGGLGVYIPPDSLVSLDRPEFAFIRDSAKPEVKQIRIKAKKLRGVWSMGLLIPAPSGARVGDDLATDLSVVHYEPPEPSGKLTGGLCESLPRYTRPARDECDRVATYEYPVYDVESFRKYGRQVFEPGERVWLTEKIHGSSARMLWDGKRFYCGSRNQWKREDDTNLWWKALNGHPEVKEFLIRNPGLALYGEVYGCVQDLRYGTKKGEVRLAFFDILEEGKWLGAERAFSIATSNSIPWVPIVGVIPFDFDTVLNFAEGPSMIPGANNLREGIVVKPQINRWHPECGRVVLKLVSNEYLSRA